MKKKIYLQQKFSRKVLVPETTSDFSLRFNKSYVPFTFKFPMVMHFALVLHMCFGTKNNFYAPGLKGPSGAFRNRIVRLSTRLFVCNSVQLTNKVQYLKLRWSYSNQTWTVSSSKGCWHFTDITCPWSGMGSKGRTCRFCYILTLLLPGASVFYKHMLNLSGRIMVLRGRLGIRLSVYGSVHKACKHDTDWTVPARTVKLGTNTTYSLPALHGKKPQLGRC